MICLPAEDERIQARLHALASSGESFEHITERYDIEWQECLQQSKKSLTGSALLDKIEQEDSKLIKVQY